MYTVNCSVMINIKLSTAVWHTVQKSYPEVAESVFRKMVKRFPGVDDSHIKIGEPTFQEVVMPYYENIELRHVTRSRFFQITVPVTDLIESYSHLSENMFKMQSILHCSVLDYITTVAATERRRLEVRQLLGGIYGSDAYKIYKKNKKK